MLTFILFWMAKYILQLAFVGVVLLVAIIINLPTAVERTFCKHERYRETRACDAICINCGRNLGFIQPLRERDSLRAKQKEQQDERN